MNLDGHRPGLEMGGSKEEEVGERMQELLRVV